MQEGTIPFGIARVKNHTFRSVFGLDRVQTAGDFTIGFVPRNGFKLSLASLSHTAQRRAYPILTIDVLTVGQALGAEKAVVHRMIGSSFDLDDLSVLYIGVDPTVKGGTADIAKGMFDIDTCLCTGDFGFEQALSLIHK